MLDQAYAVGAERALEEFHKNASTLAPVLAGGLAGGVLSATGGVPGSLLAVPGSTTQGAVQGAGAVAGAKMLSRLGQSVPAKALLGLLGMTGGWQGMNVAYNSLDRR